MLVRDDLPGGTQLAQAVHAAVEYTLKEPDRAGAAPTVVVLSVPDETSLLSRFASNGLLFREPDLDGQATAFAVVDDGRSFSDLPLAGGVAMV